MKKLLLISTMFVLCNSLFSQTQFRQWYSAPNNSNVTALPQVNSSITGSAIDVANGIYDGSSNHNLIFYVESGNVRNASGGIIGTIAYMPIADNATTTEYVIVPYPDNVPCGQNKYYIFWVIEEPYAINNIPQGYDDAGIYYITVDMNANFGAGGLVVGSSLTLDQFLNGEFGGLAVSKKDVNGNRFLYAIRGTEFGEGKIDRFTISTSGISAATAILGIGSSNRCSTG